jgi:prepilin-type N-terminal cleavage/methylation domain-containing protein
MIPSRPRPGVTLVELLVVLAVLGIAGGIAGVAFTATTSPDVGESWQMAIVAARRDALSNARPVTIDLVVDGTPASATAMPDGSVVADAAIPVDPFNGRPYHGR